MPQSLAIVLLGLVAAIAYGLLLDQVTIRVCVEYFTLGHPAVFATQDPTLLALGWGVLATWWVGLLLGVALAMAARAGARPRRSASSLVRPIARLLAATAATALLAGVLGGLLARAGYVFLVGPIAERLPPDRHGRFLANLWAHTASYGAAFLGGSVLALRTWRSRAFAVGASTAAPAP